MDCNLNHAADFSQDNQDEVWMRLESGMALRHASARITLPVAITGTHLHFPVWERKFG